MADVVKIHFPADYGVFAAEKLLNQSMQDYQQDH
jgi:hypothetical protein